MSGLLNLLQQPNNPNTPPLPDTAQPNALQQVIQRWLAQAQQPGLNSGGNAPIGAPPTLNPASFRVDFHKPESPEPQQ